MKRLSLLIGAALTAGVVAVVATLAARAFQGGGPTGPSGEALATPSIGEPVFPVSGAPNTLTTDQLARARTVIGSDKRLAALLSSGAYSIASIDPWTSGSELIGAGVEITFNQPVDFSGVVPEIATASDVAAGVRQQNGYSTIDKTVSIHGLTRVVVFVDLRSNAFAALAPLETTQNNGPATSGQDPTQDAIVP